MNYEEWDVKRAEDVNQGDLIRLATSKTEWVVKSVLVEEARVTFDLENFSTGAGLITSRPNKAIIEYEKEPYDYRYTDSVDYEK